MKFEEAIKIDVGEGEQFHVFYKKSFCGRLKKGEKATIENVENLIINHNGFYVCEVRQWFEIAVDLELKDLDFKYRSNSFEAGAYSRQSEIDDLKWMLKNSNGQADVFL